MVKQIANKPVSMPVLKRESVLCSRAQDTGRKGVREIGDVVIVRGSEVDQAGEVGGDGVEGGDVVKT